MGAQDDDIAAVRAHIGGLGGLGGSYARILDVEQSGFAMPNRWPMRVYRVRAERPGGGVTTIMVGVNLSFFGPGQVVQLDRAGLSPASGPQAVIVEGGHTFAETPVTRRSPWTLALIPVFLVGLGLFFAIPNLVFDFPAANEARKDLAAAYPEKALAISEIRWHDVDTTCGWYTVGTDPHHWRFLNNRTDLYAEGVNPAWRDSKSHFINDLWSSCINSDNRWANDSWYIGPIVLRLLKLTS